MLHDSCVPVAAFAECVGVWSRRELFEPVTTRIDAPIHVRWLQTQCFGSAVSSSFYADLRIAADRPDFAGVCSLAECNEAQLAWLCAQKRSAASFLCNAALTPVAGFQ
jgi:hypothetical protein